MELNSILSQIDSLKKEAESLKPFKPEWERVFWEKFRLEFNYNSNHIEGNTLTYGQTQLLLIFDRVSGENTGREIEEMKAHDVALKMVREMSGDPDLELSEKLLKEINELILVRPFYNKAITPDGQPTKRLITPGTYKKYPNSVLLQNGEMFYYASPEETPALMSDLLNWYNQEKTIIHPVRLAAIFHYKLVRIHPFDDSNGRTTRLGMNYILMRNGYAPIVIESKHKDKYFAALNKADLGDIEAFEEYIENISNKWQGLYLKAKKGENIEEPGDFEKEVQLFKRNLENGKNPTQKISTEVAETLFNQSLIKLFTVTIKKLSVLDQLFFEKNIILLINGNSFHLNSSDEISSLLDKEKNKISNNSSANLQYIFKGFSTSKNDVIDIYFEMQIRFFEYNYEIFFINQNKPLVKKKYGQQLSHEDIEEIAEIAAKKVFSEIKSHSDN